MVKALNCTQDWICPKKDKEERIDVEELEQLEKGMFLIFNFILDHFYILVCLIVLKLIYHAFLDFFLVTWFNNLHMWRILL